MSHGGPGQHLPVAALLTAWLCLGLLAACGEQAPPPPRSIVLVTLDTTRADHLSCYGHPLELTPRIDEVADRGVLFEQAYAPMGQTLPSHSTLLTGQWPRSHGALENHFLLSDAVTTLAEDLAAWGYATAGFVGTRVLEAETGIAQGFLDWDEDGFLLDEGAKVAERSADVLVERVLNWADGFGGERPYFVWANFFDPHTPFEAPDEFRAQVDSAVVEELVLGRLDQMRRLGQQAGDGERPRIGGYWADYAAEVRFTDHHVGRMLDGLEQRGLLDDAVVVIVGDHGEGLLEHGERGHGLNLFDEIMRVPLIIAAPDGERAGTRVSQPVSLIDVRGTVLRLALGEALDAPGGGGRGLAGTDGGDLWSELRARGEPRARPVFLERPHYMPGHLARRTNSFYPQGRAEGEMLAVVAEGHKLLVEPDGTEWLFDLQADPAEFEDRKMADAARAARLRALLDDWREANPVRHEADEQVLSPERRKVLEQLGY